MEIDSDELIMVLEKIASKLSDLAIILIIGGILLFWK